ncbi:unnamed protein product [Meganyctiphanes norvegica]|uniref:PH domain-containing protein n=1 Tax=Meganyctiphanes norvegica TaxID=48144 RepID=A0AAV2S0W9_MEGNR
MKIDNDVYKFRAHCIEEREEWVNKLQNASEINQELSPERSIPVIEQPDGSVPSFNDQRIQVLKQPEGRIPYLIDQSIPAKEQPVGSVPSFDEQSIPVIEKSEESLISYDDQNIPVIEQSEGSVNSFDDQSIHNIEQQLGLPLISDPNEVEELLKNAAMVYVGFLTIGMGSLLPWNFFITAESYWQYKFRNTSDTSSEHGTMTTLQKLWSPLQVCFSNLSYFIFLFVNAFFFSKFRQHFRVLGPMALMVSFFVVNATFANIPSTDSWQIGFFVTTILIISMMNMCGAVLVSNLYGIAGMFSTPYVMSALLSGEAISGILAALARIVSVAIDCDCHIRDATIYFVFAIGVLLLSSLAYMRMSKIDFYREYASFQSIQDNSFEENLKEFLTVFKKIWPLSLSIFWIFFITISVYPAICIRIKSRSSGDKTWSDIYFRPVITFFLFSICDLIGRQVAVFCMCTGEFPYKILFSCLARTAYIPLFLMCNNENKLIPIVLGNENADNVYIPLMITFAFSNGYLMALCMIHAPKTFPSARNKRITGFIMAAMKGFGLLMGGVLSLILELIK